MIILCRWNFLVVRLFWYKPCVLGSLQYNKDGKTQPPPWLSILPLSLTQPSRLSLPGFCLPPLFPSICSNPMGSSLLILHVTLPSPLSQPGIPSSDSPRLLLFIPQISASMFLSPESILWFFRPLRFLSSSSHCQLYLLLFPQLGWDHLPCDVI